MSDYLTGAGHFGVGFVIGFAIFLLLLIAIRKALWARLYGPFIPFMLGGLAALPYFFTHQLMCDYSSWVQVFFFYPFFFRANFDIFGRPSSQKQPLGGCHGSSV